jgi:hypothetical protein
MELGIHTVEEEFGNFNAISTPPEEEKEFVPVKPDDIQADIDKYLNNSFLTEESPGLNLARRNRKQKLTK